MSTEYRPQLLQLRNFLRYLERYWDVYPEPTNVAAARDEIRAFLQMALGIPEHVDDRDPFKGLEAYDVEDSDIFFGRQSERKASVEQLETLWASSNPTFFGIVAGSGVGKSSFMRAGLIGHLCDLNYKGEHAYCGFCVRPSELLPPEEAATLGAADREGINPMRELFRFALRSLDDADVLAPATDLDAEVDRLARLKAELQPRAAVERLEALLGSRRLLVGLDQFEEVIDQRAVPDLRPVWQPLVDFVAASVQSEPIGIIYTLQYNRGDALSLDPTLGPLQASGSQRSLSFPEQSLGDIIAEPFRKARAPLEPALADELERRIRKFADSPDGTTPVRLDRNRRTALNSEGRASLLPLVSLTMRRIYEKVAAPALHEAQQASADHADGTGNSSVSEPAPARPGGEAADAFAKVSSERRDDTGPPTIVLRLDDCGDLLDVGAAIADLADQAVEAAREASGPDWSDEDTLNGLLDRLVRPDGLYRNRFSLPAVPIPESGARRRLAEEFRRRRLLIEHSWRADHVQLVHEAVLHYWEPAREWLESRRDLMELEEEVQLFARKWDSGGRTDDGLVAHEVDKAAELLARRWEPFRVRDVQPDVELLRSFCLELMRAHPSPSKVIANTERGTRHIGVAAAYGDADLIRHFIDKEPESVHAERADGRTPLFWPSFDGNEEVISVLVGAGAAVDHADEENWRPVHAAATMGRLGALRILAHNGASVDIPGGPGDLTPLHLASMHGHADLVDYLMRSDQGVDATAVDADGWSALHFAARNSHEDVVRTLLGYQVAPVPRLPSAGWTPLHLAAQQGDPRIAALLVEEGANADEALDDGRTALHIAAEHGNAAVIAALLDLEAKPHVDRPASDERTALHIAAESNHADVVRALVEGGADTGIQNKDGRTALHVAAEKGHVEVARAFHGYADLAGLDRQGRWPLRSALAARQFDLARVMIEEMGVVTDEPRDDGWALLHLAALSGNEQEVGFLLEMGADPGIPGPDETTPLHLAAETGRNAVIPLLLKQPGTDAVAREVDGATPLHVAVERGHVQAARLLLEHASAAAGIADDRGWRPLHLAAQAGDVQVVQRLLDAGAPVEGAVANGQVPAPLTPLQAAAEVGNEKVVALLAHRGATLSASTKTKPAPLILAIRNGLYAVALRLISLGAVIPATPVGGKQTIADLYAANVVRREQAGDPWAPAEAEVGRRLVDAGFDLPFEVPEPAPPTSEGQADRAAPPVAHQRNVSFGSAWTPAGDQMRAWLLDMVDGIDGVITPDAGRTRIDVTTLAWYAGLRLVRLTDEDWSPDDLAIYYLTNYGLNEEYGAEAKETIWRLNGTSPPIHEVNAGAPIRLDDDNVLDYLRFFCYFVRGGGGAVLHRRNQRRSLASSVAGSTHAYAIRAYATSGDLRRAK